MLILKPLSMDWSVAGANIPAVTFIAQAGLPARELAHMLDSLVRVSRRVEENHFVTKCTHLSPNRHEINPAGKSMEPAVIPKHEQRLTNKLRNITHS